MKKIYMLCFVLLAGCMTQEQMMAQRQAERAAQLAGFKALCVNQYGYQGQALSQCIQAQDQEAARIEAQRRQRWNNMASYFGCQGQGGIGNPYTGQCTPRPQNTSRSGTVYDNRNNAVGTFRY